MFKKHRLLIVEHHPIVVEGFIRMIDSQDDLEVCGTAATESEALEKARSTDPDLVVAELRLVQGHGLELLKQIGESFYVLVISGAGESIFAKRVYESGARGFISKDTSIDQVMHGIREVLTGELYFSGKSRVAPGVSTSGMVELSDREIEVFQLLGCGISSKAIANRLSLSAKTVDRYRENIKSKLDLADSTELIQRATLWVMENY